MARRERSGETEYDFHGLRVEAVGARLAAILARHAPRGETVRIVHGKGTGALAAEILRLARADPRVEDAYTSGLNPGVTILALRPSPPPPLSPSLPVPPVRRHKRR